MPNYATLSANQREVYNIIDRKLGVVPNLLGREDADQLIAGIVEEIWEKLEEFEGRDSDERD